MKKLLFVSVLLLSFFYGANLNAHAVVTEHSLIIEQPRAHQAKTVELTFNSKIELKLSQIYLVSKGDKQTLLAVSKGEHKGSIVVTIPPLSPGDYALMYKIFAADGHLTEDIIHFSVNP